MKKKLFSLALILCLCMGFVMPAAAANEAAQAIAAYKGVTAAPPALDNYYSVYAGHFYLDFDNNGVPELVLLYKTKESFQEPGDMALILYYYDGAARRMATGFPSVGFGPAEYNASGLFSTFGASGGSSGGIIRFSDGTYGFQASCWGFDDDSASVRYSSNALKPTTAKGTPVYSLSTDRIPSPEQFYTAPADPFADFALANNGASIVGYHGAGGVITIPDGVVQIGTHAFADCAGLTGVRLNSGLQQIDESAFAGCAQLSSVTIPASVTEIGDGAFSACGLTSVTLQPGLKQIGWSMFFGCGKLKTLTLPASVTDVGGWAFAECDSLTDLIIENGNAQIGEYAFAQKDDAGVQVVGNLPNVTVHAPAGGAVESYCRENNIRFAPRSFTDVSISSPYADAIEWAVAQKITTGKTASVFAPEEECTQAQILTFLWRAYGSPEPSGDNPFTNDIPDAYAKAAVWACEKGLVPGGAFNVNQPCTRAMAVTYLWQAAGAPAPSVSVGFTDVPASAAYAQAVSWALEKGITTGTSAAAFSPDDICRRGQIVTFLFRNLA